MSTAAKIPFWQAYLAVALPLLLADALWLGIVARTFYRTALGPLMTRHVKWPAAAIFYLGYPVGLVLFVILRATSPTDAALWGSLFGLFCYGTYDLVNHATLDGWPLRLTVVDMAWGTVLSATSCAIAILLLR